MSEQDATGALPARGQGSPFVMPARFVLHLAAVLLIAALAFLNWRFILVHFSNGGYLLDSGWFAYLMGSADLTLPNPQSIVDFSYYNMHIAPYLALFGMPLTAIGIDGYTIFALHEGLMFGLFAGSLYTIVGVIPRRPAPATLLAAALAVGVAGKMVWQITGYPHFEIATIALCSGGAALLLAGRPRISAIAFVTALLVREDGGLFVALFLIGSAMLRASSPWDWKLWSRALELRFAILAIAVSACLFWIKAHYFFRYPTFEFTYSGNGWDHLTWAWFGNRLKEAFADPKLVVTAGLAVGLGVVSWRYLIYPVLILPLIMAQLLAVSDGIGKFHAYYVMPWLVVWTGLLIVAAVRAGEGVIRKGEGATLLMCALLCSIAMPNVSNGWRDTWVIRHAITYPVVDLASIARELEAAIGPDRADVCLSVGAVSLLPNAITPKQLVNDRRDIGHCGRIFVFIGDMGFRRLQEKILAEGKTHVGDIGGRIEIYQ